MFDDSDKALEWGSWRAVLSACFDYAFLYALTFLPLGNVFVLHVSVVT